MRTLTVSRGGVALALIAGSALVGSSTWSGGPASAAPRVRPVTVRVSVRSGGGQAEGGSSSSVLSATGRYVAFTSSASDLVPGDANGVHDVFVRDRRRGTTRLISVSSRGAHANGPSFVFGMSANGRYVAFSSDASNLVSRDTNRRPDIFVRDRRAGTTRRVSVASSGAEANAGSFGAARGISGNGRYVAFSSDATNLVRNDTNATLDVFVHDLRKGTTQRVSVSSNGAQGNASSFGGSLSRSGRYVAFSSQASDLVRGDTNEVGDVFVRDVWLGTTRRVSVSSTGAQGEGASTAGDISANGKRVTFTSGSETFVPDIPVGAEQVYVRDLRTRKTALVSASTSGAASEEDTFSAALSPSGRYAAFSTAASNLVPHDTNGAIDVFVRDLRKGTLRRVSVSTRGVQADGDSLAPAFSHVGRTITFFSLASNLVPGDTNGGFDVFVRMIRR